jgi:hypothetical protein
MKYLHEIGPSIHPPNPRPGHAACRIYCNKSERQHTKTQIGTELPSWVSSGSLCVKYLLNISIMQ